MKRMLFNATQQEELRVAIVNGQKLIDIDIETTGRELRKSNIYKGVITRIEPSLEACFVNYGEERHGFLPFKEVARGYFKEGIDVRNASIKDALREGQEIMIQVEKEERGNKGAALTTFVSLAGRYLVLMPNNPRGGGVSRRVEGEERQELRETMDKLDLPTGMSVIARTAGIGRNVDELQWDLNYLMQLWTAIDGAGKSSPGAFLIYQESSLVIRAIRDYFQPDIGEILIDTDDIYEQAQQFMSHVMPDMVHRVKRYSDDVPLFSRFQIEHQIETAYARTVPLPSGGAIVIDHTEALVSVDVNSARSTRGTDIETTAFNTNCEAAEEVARQLRLRDLGGLIVIDFIDMENAKNQREVETRLKDSLRYDRARVQMGKISRFGLMELSRQRLRPSLSEGSHVTCPRCNGTAHIRDTESSALQVLRIIQEEAMKEHSAAIHVQVPVDVAAFLLNEKRGEILKIETRHRVTVILIPNTHLETPHYKLDRLKHDDPRLEEVHASYAMAEQADTDIGYSKRQKEDIKPRQEAMVKSITPDTAPQVERKVVVKETPAAPVAAPQSSGGFLTRIMNWFRASPEASEVKAPAIEVKPQATQTERPERERNGRNQQRNRNGRNRNERTEREERPQNSRVEQKLDAKESRESKPDLNSLSAVSTVNPAETPVRNAKQPRPPRPPREEREGKDARRGKPQREALVTEPKTDAKADASSEQKVQEVLINTALPLSTTTASAATTLANPKADENGLATEQENSEQSEVRRRRRRGGRNRNRRDRDDTENFDASETQAQGDSSDASARISNSNGNHAQDAHSAFIPVADLAVAAAATLAVANAHAQTVETTVAQASKSEHATPANVITTATVAEVKEVTSVTPVAASMQVQPQAVTTVVTPDATPSATPATPVNLVIEQVAPQVLHTEAAATGVETAAKPATVSPTVSANEVVTEQTNLSQAVTDVTTVASSNVESIPAASSPLHAETDTPTLVQADLPAVITAETVNPISAESVESPSAVAEVAANVVSDLVTNLVTEVVAEVQPATSTLTQASIDTIATQEAHQEVQEVSLPVQASLDLSPMPATEQASVSTELAETTANTATSLSSAAPAEVSDVAAVSPVEIVTATVTDAALVSPATVLTATETKPAQADTTLALEGLHSMLAQVSLTLASTDPEKMRAAQISAAAITKPKRVPRERKVVAPVSNEPLVMVDTKRP